MNWLIGGVVVLALIVGGVMVAGQADKDAMMEKDSAMMEKDVAMVKDDTMMKDEVMMDDAMQKDEGVMMQKDETMNPPAGGEGAMMEKGSYESYAAAKLAKANEGDVVLFFRASWCPTCRALDADIKSNLSKIPAGVTILDVNYDTETALKQKYGVTYQHTLVQVDAQGNLITKWSGGLALADLVSKIQ